MAKTIAITGAGDGLGRALARRLAADGDRVILLGRTPAKIAAVAAELGEGHLAIPCDVADPQSVREAFARITTAVERLDVLVNNAGVYQPFTLEEASDSQIRDILSINLAGPIYCAREALPLLKGGGHIINITSESSDLKMPMLWLYASTKQALELTSAMWDNELKDAGVRVTAVRAGQMMDETKTAPPWPMDVAIRFAEAAARAGLNLRERGITHYASVATALRAIIDAPADLHMPLVTLTARKP